MKKLLLLLGGVLISTSAGCMSQYPQQYSPPYYPPYTPPIQIEQPPVQDGPSDLGNPYSWERNPAYNNGSSSAPVFSQPTPERQMWLNNAYTPSTTFRNAPQIERHILDETRGADFNNPVDRRDAEIRAAQIRERAWREQTKQWNAELERRGAVRQRN